MLLGDRSITASASSAGDVNGDGFSDVIIGGPYFDSAGYVNDGRVDVWYGGSNPMTNGLATTSSTSTTCAASNWSAVGGQNYAVFGSSVATLGDVSGDGLSDIIVGAPRYDGTLTDEGRASVWYGTGAGLGSSSNWSMLGGQAGAWFGHSVASAGDVSGDGYSDALVSMIGWNGGVYQGGRVDLYYGNGNRGLSVAPQQVRGSDGTTPVQLLGSSGSSTQVNVRLRTARSWMGRGRAKLQWEVRLLGAPFTGPAACGAACGVSSSWTDLGTLGTQIQALATGLTPDRAHHWRLRVLTFPNITGSWYSIGPNAASETDFRTPP